MPPHTLWGMYFPLNVVKKDPEKPAGKAGKGNTFARPRDATRCTVDSRPVANEKLSPSLQRLPSYFSSGAPPDGIIQAPRYYSGSLFTGSNPSKPSQVSCLPLYF